MFYTQSNTMDINHKWLKAFKMWPVTDGLHFEFYFILIKLLRLVEVIVLNNAATKNWF